jgi:hypothetical protein
MVSKLSEYDTGSFRILTFYPSGSRIGGKISHQIQEPNPQHRNKYYIDRTLPVVHKLYVYKSPGVGSGSQYILIQLICNTA